LCHLVVITPQLEGKDGLHILPLEQAILQQISEQVSTTLRSVQCSEHGQYAKVTVKGQSLEKLSFEVSGCCQALVDQCIAKLK
jgi:hypothetical protein